LSKVLHHPNIAAADKLHEKIYDNNKKNTIKLSKKLKTSFLTKNTSFCFFIFSMILYGQQQNFNFFLFFVKYYYYYLVYIQVSLTNFFLFAQKNFLFAGFFPFFKRYKIFKKNIFPTFYFFFFI
jgi:hypothetical protein